MIRGALEPWHIILILGILVLLFGSRKLPDAARSVGQSLRIFKSEVRAAATDDQQAQQQTAAPTSPLAVESDAAGSLTTDALSRSANAHQA